MKILSKMSILIYSTDYNCFESKKSTLADTYFWRMSAANAYSFHVNFLSLLKRIEGTIAIATQVSLEDIDCHS